MRYGVLLFLIAIACVLMLSCIATVSAHDPIVLHAGVAMLFSVHADTVNTGRWFVCHPVAGISGVFQVVESCLTRESAERECAWQQAEHERALRLAGYYEQLKRVRA